MFTSSVLICSLLLLTSPVHMFADSVRHNAPNVVADWAAIVQPAIHKASVPRSGGTAQILHTIVMLAVYDATMAIEGGYRPYAADIRAPRHADVRAAVATAAYLAARARVAESQYAYLDEQYVTYLANIPDDDAKNKGIRVGAEAAVAMLALRANDGFDNVVPYVCSVVPPPVGEFEPDTGCPTVPTDPQPADAKVGRIQPFTFSDPSRLRPRGPSPLSSATYTADFIETRDFGRADSVVRSPEQTDVAYFWSEHPYVFWNRNLINLAISRGLNVRETARFFALVHTATSDAVIAGFEAKYFYTAWRPRTAIPQAAMDGNPDTDSDPYWTPLLQVNHPEYPSGHGFWSTAVTDAVASFFRTDRVRWTLVASKVAVPQLVRTERTYDDLNGIMREVDNARVWAGLHWRHSMRDGAKIGRAVVRHVARNFFRPMRCHWLSAGRPCR
ncbi:MAG: vanadium-dependent haloperoxidase [Vicinamibacteraceae bacterium]